MDKLDASPAAAVSGNGAHLWDCDSSLYDSFELTSFRRQLDAAITSARCFSMPHLSEPRGAVPETDQFRKKQSRLSKSMQKLIRSLFRLKPTAASAGPPHPTSINQHPDDVFHSSYSDLGGLRSIPEVCEKDLHSPESGPTARRTASQRFPATALTAVA